MAPRTAARCAARTGAARLPAVLAGRPPASGLGSTPWPPPSRASPRPALVADFGEGGGERSIP